MDPGRSPILDHDSIDAEFDRVLKEIADISEEPEKTKEDINFHAGLASAIVNHTVDNNGNKSARLAIKLIQQDEREERKRKNKEQEDQNMAQLEALYELFPCIGKKQVDMVYRGHEFDFDRTVDELAGSTISLCDNNNVPVWPRSSSKTIYSRSPVVFNHQKAPVNPSSPMRDKMTEEEEAIQTANSLAKELRRRASHHTNQAFHHGPKSLTFGALTAIAREERNDARKCEDRADAFVAQRVMDSVDLHSYGVERALRFVMTVIETVRKRRPDQKRLNVITGRGANNSSGQPVLKTAIIHFFNALNVRFSLDDNPGVIIVYLA